MKTKTKQKISKSLKNYHNRKQIAQDLAVLLVIIGVIITMFGSNNIIKAYNEVENEKQVTSQDLVEKLTTGQIEAKNDMSGEGLEVALNHDLSVKEKLNLIAVEICEDRGLGDYCINDLMAMAFVESNFDNHAIGDHGQSHGLFQIHRGYHRHITIEQARDIRFSAEWTIDRMIHYGYPEYRSNAIRRHNGSPANPKTKLYLEKVNAFVGSINLNKINKVTL